MRIDIKLLDKDMPMPRYAHDGDAGCDLRSRIDQIIPPGERALIPTGISIAIPAGYAGFVQPRSGLALKHGISIVNTPGLIDSKYRGEIGVILINTDKSDSFEVRKGDKIAQLVVLKVEHAHFTVVDELDETVRGDKGFGSTGV
ncbi:MAG TPA: dUTP diphosphatase [Anaerolineae bacterium]|nr:dUTP diphosphatase [Anaerolineae bacterium]